MFDTVYAGLFLHHHLINRVDLTAYTDRDTVLKPALFGSGEYYLSSKPNSLVAFRTVDLVFLLEIAPGVP